jgi:hypothetical protein
MTDGKNGKITLSQIAILEQALDEAPTRSTTDVGKAKAISILAPKLHALRGKGYAWREIAAWLTERGVVVTAVSLQRYLREEKLAATRRDKVRPTSRRSGPARDVTPTTTSSPVAAVSANASTPQPGPRTPPHAAPVPAGSRPPHPSSFVPRPDSEKT